MNKSKRIGRMALCLIVSFVMIMTLIPRLPASMAFAAVGQTPAHNKTLKNNNDGTYTISLDVKGDSEKQPNNVNVIVIVDRSNSMGDGSGTGAYVASNSNGTNMYGLVDGEYVPLTRQGYYGNYTYWYNNDGTSTQYTGQRYQHDTNATRLEATKEAVNSLASALLGYNGVDGNDDDTVEMALVQFGTSASTRVASTTDPDTYVNSVNGISTPGGIQGGTNWEAALKQANTINFGDTDPTYVIFFSDGAPTFHSTDGGYGNYNSDAGCYGTGGEDPNNGSTNMNRCYTQATDDAKTLAEKVGVDKFFTIFAYGETYGATYMSNLTAAAGAPAANNYSASSSAELKDAFAAILEAIEMSGIGNTSINDGTTNKVTTTSGEIAELLEVDTSSYKYYRSGGSYGNMTPWAEAPAATFENGAVKWDLSEEGVLENDVTYTVTFDCYPSQYTYDTIAKLKNGDITYNSLDSEVKKYIVDNGDGSYSLLTNTNATLSYDDTRDEEGQQTVGYTNPDPVGTTVQTLSATKEWEGGDADTDSLEMTVLMDDKPFHTATLTKTGGWTTSSFISVGIIKNGQVLSGAEGHDFKFAELDDTQYHWELDTPTVRPMLINGTLTMLVKVDKTHPLPSGATTYTIKGATYYVDSSTAGLTATNHRRSNLNLTKVVTGNEAPEDAVFPFTLTVNNSKAPTTAPTDDPEHNSDYYVWFSIYDTKAGATVTDATVSASGLVGPNEKGYYNVPSGTAITVNMKEGWNLRFINLPSGSTYTFAEGNTTGFTFVSSVLTQGQDSTFSGAKTTTGKIENTKTSYTVTYTNQYNPVKATPKVTKKVTGWDATEAFTFSIAPKEGDTVTANAIRDGFIVMPDPATVTTAANIQNGGQETLTFGGIEFFREGTYKFTIDETTTTTAAGWTYDSSTKDITITVSAGTDGKLSATIDGDNPTFENKYEAKSVKAQIPVKKNVTPENSGAADITGKFTFTLTAGDNTAGNGVTTPMPSSNTVLCGADGAEVKFGEIEYSVPGTYTYTVTESETNGPVGGITMDTDKPRTITVVVTDNGSGQLSATVNGGATVTFNNPYQVTSLDITIPVEKILEVPAGLTGPDITNKYTFTIADDTSDDVSSPLPTKSTTLTNPGAAGGSMTFGEEATTGKITITQPGTYKYTITESGRVAGVDNDEEATKTVTVVVTDNGDGTMSYTVNGGGDAATTKFTNKYDVEPVTASFPVQKVLSVPQGMEGPATWSYTFNVAAGEGAPTANPMSATVSNTNDTATFGPFSFEKPGTYTYTVTESGTVEGVVNDPAATSGKTVTVTVTDNKDGTLKAEVTSTEQSPLQFTNSYHETGITIPVNKTLAKDPADLEGPDITGKYTFTISGSNGAPMPENTTVTNSGGAMSFGPINFNEPGEYTYTVRETGTVAGVTNDTEQPKTVTVKVTRDETTGDLTATYVGATSFDFVNTYRVTPVTASFPVKKVMQITGLGPKSWSYTIDVKANGGAPEADTMTGTVTNTKDTVTFGDFTFTKPGTYTYTVTETGTIAGVENDAAATTGKTVTITVTDQKDGTLKAEVSSTTDKPLTFTNTYTYQSTTATIQVHKDLVAENPKVSLPDITGKYTFKLAGKDGAPMPTEDTSVTNPAADGGTAQFGTITYTEPGVYTYVVTEEGTVKNVTNDPEAASGKTVTVTVVDGQDGKLVATVTYPGDNAEVDFTNTYKADPVEISFPVQKVLSVPQGLVGPEEWEYTFTVSAGEGVPVAKTMTATVDQDNDTATFGPFSYTDPGTYTYTVKEDGTVAGVDNDEAAATGKTVTVTVTDNGDGTLSATATSTANAPLQFTNTYSVEPIKAKFPVKKVLEVPAGLDGPEEWEYTINVTGTPAAATMTGKVNQDTDTVTFGDFTYTAPGTYTYTVSETGTITGVENDPQASGKTVTVTVVDNGDGTLTATPTSTDAKPLTFTNTYGVTPDTVTFPVKKIMSVPEGLTGPATWSYTVNVAANSGAPVAQTMTGTVSNTTDTVTFGPFSYNAPGTYTYTVTETGTIAGVTNDSAATSGKTVTVSVVDNGDGSLTATADFDEDTPLTFTNTYHVDPTTAKFPVTKEVVVPEGFAGPDDWEFTVNVEGTPAAQTMTGKVTKAEPTVTFGDFTYTAPGEYTYKVTETGTVAGITNDEAATTGKTVTVNVVDNGDGTLTATPSSTEAEPLTFTNNYVVPPITASIPVEKILSVAEGLNAPSIKNKFTFTLTAADGTPMPETKSYTNPDADGGDMTFGDITFDKPGTYTYTVTETGEVAGVSAVGATEKTVTISVVDNKDGTMTATVNGGQKLQFTNEYKVGEATAEIPVNKILEVAEGLTPDSIEGKFTFTLTAADGTPMPKTTSFTNPDATGGKVTFGGEDDPITFTKPGTYTYTVTETGSADGVTNDKTASKTVTVVVTDNGDGTMTAVVNEGKELDFTNTYTVKPTKASFPVEKILEVPEGLNPDSIKNKFTFTLTAEEGTPMPKVTEYTNPDADGGTVTFGDIEYTEPGTYTYTVTETGEVDGITNDTE